jgi:hypothetical protein
METSPPSAALPLPAAPAYRDRRTGLIIFGILEIILGAFMALAVPLSVFGQVMAAKQQGQAADMTSLASAGITLGVLAIGLIWLGIGSIQARRWARALLLCGGWMALAFGLPALILVIASLGSLDAALQQSGQKLPAGALLIGKIAAVGMVLLMYVIIPGAVVLFYRSPHVKRTCEQRDPVVRWTDRCPLPIIAFCVVQAYAVIYMLCLPKFGQAVPLFGTFVTGWTASAVWLAYALFMLWAMRGFYRLDRRVWLVYVIVICATGLSSLVTFFRINVLDYYRLIGLPEWQIKQVALSPLVQGNNFLWVCGLSLVLGVGYLLFLRRYFVGPRQSGA